MRRLVDCIGLVCVLSTLMVGCEPKSKPPSIEHRAVIPLPDIVNIKRVTGIPLPEKAIVHNYSEEQILNLVVCVELTMSNGDWEMLKKDLSTLAPGGNERALAAGQHLRWWPSKLRDDQLAFRYGTKSGNTFKSYYFLKSPLVDDEVSVFIGCIFEG